MCRFAAPPFGRGPEDAGRTAGAKGGKKGTRRWLGKNLAKLDDAEITTNRKGASNDPKADAAVKFAAKVAGERGHVSEDDLRSVKMAGYSDGQIIEIVQHVALNVWTNYLNEVLKTEVDFPVFTSRH